MPAPFVTFVLFAYNQESFIREAVESALSQTYEPLEIVLSDDGSSDRTFEIMREMASAYRGPHQVRAVQTPHNLGLVDHVFTRGREARGEIVVVAAGDDVSKPHRTARLVEAFGDDETVMAVTSGYDVIDEAGGLISANQFRPSGLAAATGGSAYFRGLDFEFNTIQGSVASYRRKAFHFPIPPGDTGLWEDNLLNFLIYANGGWVKARTESLVCYRRHSGALVNRAAEALSMEERERRTLVAAEKYARRMESFLWISRSCARPELVNLPLIQRDLHRHRLVAAWPRMSVRRRTMSLVSTLAAGSGTAPLKWQAARLFGRFPNYLPKAWIAARRSK